MKFLSLWQPWAALCLMKNPLDGEIEKQIETRSWSTSYRGLIAIHATATLPPAAKAEIDKNPELQNFLAKHGIQNTVNSIKSNLTFGAILGVVELYDIETSESLRTWFNSIDNPYIRREQAFGNYAPNRFGWRFRNQILLTFPIPFKGAQGLRNLPQDVAEQVLAQTNGHYF